jgi:glycine/D-amino acid oxidase-like deaminating enzyme
MTRKLDLRTGQPVWHAYRTRRIVTRTLDRDIAADVLVVGMGISGAMVAQALAADGHDVAVVDRRGAIEGSTAATTALVQYEIDVPLSRLVRMIGRDRAVQAWRRSRLAIANLKERIEALDIACDLDKRDSLYLAGDVLDEEALRLEGAERRAAGIGSDFLDGEALKQRFGLARRGALLGHGNLVVDPRKLTAGLLRVAERDGARFFAPVEAVSIRSGRDGISVSTDAGHTISARHVVLATGYELGPLTPPARHRIVSTFAIATRPQPRALPSERPLIWEASDPYLYLRSTSDGRVICGGEDESFSDEARRDALLPEKSKAIATKLAALLPGIDPAPEFAWCGSFGTTTTGLPFIGRIPRQPRIYGIMGYGGNGITFSQIASEVVRSALRGTEDADAGLFGFD